LADLDVDSRSITASNTWRYRLQTNTRTNGRLLYIRKFDAENSWQI